MAGYTSATAVDNILTNLGSDLAPLLSLFGEQVTIQYLSESLTLLDNILFALAPLGIITAMVSAIRVAGGPRLRSLIGREKEGEILAESELMSSTSPNVCELWSGAGRLVRVIGDATFLNLVFVPSRNESKAHEIYTFADAVEVGIYRLRQENVDQERSPPSSTNPPNLSLNVTKKALHRNWLLVFVAVGAILQASVLVFAASVQYRLIFLSGVGGDDDPIPVYGFYILLFGTLVLAVGVFLCARIIERSTEEFSWERSDPGAKVIWLQKGNQVLGDQIFHSAGHFAEIRTITTSVKADNKHSRVELAIGASLIGFSAQFIGFRTMHPYVTLAQLGVILIMTIIRSFVHAKTRGWEGSGNFGCAADEYEIDWLAMNIPKRTEWKLSTGFRNTSYSRVGMPSSVSYHHRAIGVVDTRVRLGELSTGWGVQHRDIAESLRVAIEATMSQVFVDMALGDRDMSMLAWHLPVTEYPNEEAKIRLTVERQRDESGNWMAWRVSKKYLEAALCLLIFSTKKDELPDRRYRYVRLLGLNVGKTKNDYEVWVQRGTKLNVGPVKEPEKENFICFGWAGNEGADNPLRVDNFLWADNLLWVDTGENIATLCAQELYTRFMFELGGVITDVRGRTAQRVSDPTAGISPASPESNHQSVSEGFRLINSNLASLADLYSSSGLGSIESAYTCIIPALRDWKKLPVLNSLLIRIQKICSGGNIHSVLSSPEGYKLLQHASRDGLEETVKWLINYDVYVNTSPKDNLGATPLQEAAGGGHKAIVDMLLRARADVNARPAEHSGRTALQAAAEGGHRAVVELLLGAGADVNAEPAGDSGRTALQAAAGGGHLAVVRMLLGVRADINAKPAGDSGRTALQAAAEGGHKAVVELLLGAGADVNAAPARHSGRTALQAAAGGGHLAVVKLLLRAGADVNARPAEHSGRTTLQAAAEGGHKAVIELLLGAGAYVNAEPAGDSGRTALQAAAEGGHLEVVRMLLDVRADVNAKPAGDSGRTALQAAAGGGHLEVVRRLLGVGANANAEPAGDPGRTALQAAAEGCHLEIVDILLRAGAGVNARPAEHSGRTTLQAAAEGGHKAVIELLLGAGAYVNAEPAGDSGRTALQAAAEGGHLEVVRMLLDVRADVNARPAEHSGRTALQAAAEGGHKAVIELLLGAGAYVNAKPAGDSGRTALQAAAEGGHLEVVRMLLDVGANANAEPAGDSESGRTALQAAAGGGHLEVVDILLRAKADFNAASAKNSRRTALQAAVEGGHLEVIRMLLDVRADVNTGPAGDSGRTVLQAAAEGGHLEIVDILLRARADVNAAPAKNSGRTALQAAAEGGHLEIVEILLRAKADVNAAPAKNSGRTALQAAAHAGYGNVVELLLEAGANIDAISSGQTALQAAAKAGRQKVCEILKRAGARESNEVIGESIHEASSLKSNRSDSTGDEWHDSV